jgi:hypothetical protein
MTRPEVQPTQARRGSEAERWLALALRTIHLAAVVALGAALLGAPLGAGAPGLAVLATGLVLLAQDLHARRIALTEVAGAVVLVKLVLVAWVAWSRPAADQALAVFWVLLVLSSMSSHAPKRWRHLALRRR